MTEYAESRVSEIIYYRVDLLCNFLFNNSSCTTSLEAFLEFILAISNLIWRKPYQVGTRGSKAKNLENRFLYDESLNILNDWPNNFNVFLDHLKHRNRGTLRKSYRTTGLNRDFGNFYKRVINAVENTPFSLLSNAFKKYIHDNIFEYVSSLKCIKDIKIFHDDIIFISGNEAAKYARIKSEVILDRVENQKIHGYIDNKDNKEK